MKICHEIAVAASGAVFRLLWGRTEYSLYPRQLEIEEKRAVKEQVLLFASLRVTGEFLVVQSQIGVSLPLADAVPLPDHLSLLLASGPLDGTLLPPDTAVWLRLPL